MLIAITGGIGSGKTTVLQMIASLGGNIINADEINNELLAQEFYIKELAALFPQAVAGGKVDKVKLSKIVFYNKKALAKLNQLAHPLINQRILQKAKECSGNVFVEIPLLTESKIQHNFDRIWLIKADTSLRLTRIIERSHINKRFARRIMSLQEKDRLREKFATDIIINNGDNEHLFNQIKELYHELLNG